MLIVSQIFLGSNYHWRKVNETLCTFLTSKKLINDYWEKFTSACKFEHYPFEKPFHEIYKKELECISDAVKNSKNPYHTFVFSTINQLY